MFAHQHQQLYQSLFNQLQENTCYLLALSGGVDSIALLHLLYRTKKDKPFFLRAVHVNHGLHPQTDAWQAFCETTCAQLGVPLVTHTLSMQHTTNLEEQARIARYRTFAQTIQAHETLLLAHHADDALETFFIKLMRGTASSGAFMPQSAAFVHARLLRPLLTCNKAQIIDYAKQYELNWCEDSSNQDTHFTRNFIRHKIMSPVHERDAQTSARMAHSANLLATQLKLLDEYALTDVQQCVDEQGRLSIALLNKITDRQSRSTEHAEKQRLLLATWLKQHAVAIRDVVQLDEVGKLCCPENIAGKVRCVQAGYFNQKPCWVRRFANWLYLVPEHTPSRQIQPLTPVSQVIDLPQGTLTIATAGACVLPHDAVVRFRVGGETMRLGGMTRTLKKLWQQWRVPPWQRDTWPLVFAKNTLVCVPNHACADGYRCDKAIGLQLSWQTKTPKCL